MSELRSNGPILLAVILGPAAGLAGGDLVMRVGPYCDTGQRGWCSLFVTVFGGLLAALATHAIVRQLEKRAWFANRQAIPKAITSGKVKRALRPYSSECCDRP